MMDNLILLTVLQMVSLVGSYEFICPSQAHWNLRAKSMCKPTTNYTCLFDINLQINVYRDRCNRPRILGPGYKYVFQPNLNRAACSGNRYQPFIFETVGYSDCIFQKSFCNSLGQETYENGDTTVDRQCICNTDRGYTFVRNSTNQCFCNPSNEDCSCYLGMNSYNKTIELKDVECYHDMNIISSSFFGDLFNITRTIKIIEFDNYKYNLNYFPTNEYRMKAASSTLTLLITYFAVCIFVYTLLPRWIQSRNKIKKQKKDDRIAVINEKTEIRRYVRIQVIGKGCVGKSSLVRRLVGDSNMKVDSTDGIDIVNKCQIRTTDGEWVIGKVRTERNKIIKRIQDAVYKEQKQSKSVFQQEYPWKGENSGNEIMLSEEALSEVEKRQENKITTHDQIRIASLDSNETNDVDSIPTTSIDKSLTGENKLSNEEIITLVAEDSNIDKQFKNDSILYKDIQKSEQSVKSDDMRIKITKQMNSILVGVKKDKDRMTSESLVECGFWDFAGQKDYYATHQTFLNAHAIYLLVANISEDLEAADDGTQFDSIEEYIDFWFDSIHCLRTSSFEEELKIPEANSKHGLSPPVILVCTHIDKYKTNEEVEKRKSEYITQFRKKFGGEKKADHYRDIYFISNTKFSKSAIKDLREKIYEVAKEMNFFEEDLPMQWIQLENALSVLKDSKQNILSWQGIEELAEITSFNKRELLPFLTYQHKIGNIIFFKDIKDYIILQPDWLVKCFRCLVCDNHRNKRKIEIEQMTDWTNLENTGELSDNIIDRLFQKEHELEFAKYKTHILNVMEKFNIIVKPQFKTANTEASQISNSYYMPCMIQPKPTSLYNIRTSFEGENSSFSSSPWLILEFKFLPLAYFNHILFYYITQYTVHKEPDEQMSIYRGRALVNLDKTCFRKLCICFSKNAIALQIWRFNDVEYHGYNTILEELCGKIEELKKKLGQNIFYEIKAKCGNGDYSNKQDRHTLEELGKLCENGDYMCSEHKTKHSKNDAENTWLQHAEIVMAKLNKGRDEKNSRISFGDSNAESKSETKSVHRLSSTPSYEGSTTGDEGLTTDDEEDEANEEEAFDEDQAYVKNNLPVSVNLRQQLNIKKSSNKKLSISSCIKTSNTLVFTDYNNNRLIICNADGTDQHHIPLSYGPHYITEIDSNTVAVSCSNSTILIINISTRSITSIINARGYCYGILYNDNNLYVVMESIIRVMDLTGKVIRTIPLPSDYIRDITVDRERLICTDYTSIYCCSLDGKLMWKFEMDGFQDLNRVTTDNDGNVYVTNEEAQTVIVVSDDGKHHRELLTKSDGLDKPIGIYFDKKENVLLVCNERDGNAFLFDVMEKLT